MGWEELIDALDGLETKVEYDGYFCSVKDAVVIVVLGSLCGLKSVEGMSNEIPAVQELIRTLEISGCMVVADAQIARRHPCRILCSTAL